MTEREAATVRDLHARIALLERENRYLRQHRDKARTERNKYKHEARHLHGLLIAYRVQTKKAA